MHINRWVYIAVTSQYLQREQPNISQEIWLSKQSIKLHFACIDYVLPFHRFYALFCRIWSAIDSSILLHTLAGNAQYIYSNTMNISGEGGATLSFNSCPVGGADHCGHGDTWCLCKANWSPRSIACCSSFYPWFSNAYPLSHIQTTIQPALTIEVAPPLPLHSVGHFSLLLNHFLSICTAIHCHSLHSAISLHYRLTLMKSLRQSGQLCGNCTDITKCMENGWGCP